MEILILNHNLRGRGTWFRCSNLARQLAALGHSVTLVTAADRPGRGTVEDEGNLRIVTTPRLLPVGKHDGGYGFFDIAWRLLHLPWKQYDVVHCFAHRPNVLWPYLLMRWCRRARVFVADWSDWWCRGGIISDRRAFAFLDRAEAFFEEGSKRWADAVTVATRVLTDRAVAVGVPEDGLHCIPQGSTPELYISLHRDACRRELNLPPDAPLADFVGYSQWDVGLLLEAFVTTAEHLPEARLVLVGPVDPATEHKIVRCGLEDRVILTGQVPEGVIPKYLVACDVHCLPMQNNPANRGRLPMKLAEYMASGRPVVVNDVGDAGRLVREYRCGMAVGQSPEEFGEALADLLRDRNKAEGFAQSGLDAVRCDLNWKHQGKVLEQVYEGLLEQKQSGRTA